VEVKIAENKQNIIVSKQKYANRCSIVETSSIFEVRFMGHDCRVMGCACGVRIGTGRSGVLILDSAGESFMLLPILTEGGAGCWICFTK
jgi:hypothetical protein